ncbi:hypothetical protein B5S31_g3199 [[Candida] boidinii]|nr:hypothetical protein B5S31_g3199 [[Candida] boidinii]
MSDFSYIRSGYDHVIERPNFDSSIICGSREKRISGEADCIDIKTPKKPTVTNKTPTRYITEQNPSSCGLERKHCVKCPISCDSSCQSQSAYSYEDELLRLLDSVVEDALNGAKMRYINTALTIPVYKVDNIKSRLSKTDTELLKIWKTLLNENNVKVSTNIWIKDGNNKPDPLHDNLSYYYIRLLAKPELSDINLADDDKYSETSEEDIDTAYVFFCLTFEKDKYFL